MKKFIYSSIIALAGLLAVSCQTENKLAVYDPNSTQAPAVGEVTGAVLAKDGEAVVLEFGAVVYGFDAATIYELQDSLPEDFAMNVKVAATIADNKATVQQSDLNSTILNLGGTPEEEILVYFRLKANMMTDKNAAIESTTVYSNVVSAKFTPYNAVVPEKDSYGHIWVIGDYCGWDNGGKWDKCQYLYDYAKDNTTYSGVIDFGEKAANGWKISGAAKWDDTCNWGIDENELPNVVEEQGAIQLISSGGSKDIKVYSKRFYHFEFDKTTLMLTKTFGVDQIGIIGLNGDWDNDIVMEYNPALVRFYADIEVPAATEMKFRADADWALNWGVGLAVGAGNIPVAAGNYRVYLDLNKMEFTLDELMYGKPEPGLGADTPDTPDNPDEPVALKGWGVVGVLTGWADGADIMMTQKAAVFSVKDVTINAGEGWKIRKDGSWNVNRGIAGDTEPINVTVGAEGFAVVQGGKNMAVETTGAYDIYFDYGYDKLYVLEAGAAAPTFGETWFLCGTMSGWAEGNTDFMMTKEGDYWVFKGLTLAEEGAMKFNAGAWAAGERGATGAFSANAAMPVAASGGSDIKVPAGTYDVYLDDVNNKAYFMTDGKTPAEAGELEIEPYDLSKIVCGLAGKFNGVDAWNNPPTGNQLAAYVSSTEKSAVYKVANFALKTGDALKLILDSAWCGGTFNADNSIDIVYNGGNDIVVPEGVDGNFDITITFDYELVDKKTHTFSNIKIQIAPVA